MITSKGQKALGASNAAQPYRKMCEFYPTSNNKMHSIVALRLRSKERAGGHGIAVKRPITPDGAFGLAIQILAFNDHPAQ